MRYALAAIAAPVSFRVSDLPAQLAARSVWALPELSRRRTIGLEPQHAA